MRRALLVAAVAVLALASAALGAGPPIVRPIGSERGTPVQRGAQLFAANCSTCHGSLGGGVSPTDRTRGATDIAGAGPSLRGVGALAPDFYLTTGYMPLRNPYDQPTSSRPSFAPDEIRALTAFVASLGKGPAVPAAGVGTGSVSRGLQSFTDHCAGCHQVAAEGGVVTGARVPPLDEVTPRQIREAVRIGPYVMPRFSAKAISPAELEDLVAYVHYAQTPQDSGGWGIDHLGPFPEGLVTWFIAIVVLIGACVAIGSRLRT